VVRRRKTKRAAKRRARRNQWRANKRLALQNDERSGFARVNRRLGVVFERAPILRHAGGTDASSMAFAGATEYQTL